MHLTLSRVQSIDFSSLIPVQFLSFDYVDSNNVFFGARTPSDYASAVRTLYHAYTHDPVDV
jgi:hypothetical protein